MRRFLLSGCAVLLLMSAAGAQPACAPRGPIGFFTAEQHMMHFADVQKATAGLTFDAMRDYRFKERQRICALNADERGRLTADLTKRWNALSPAEQAAIKDQIAAWRRDHPRGMGRGGGGWGGPPSP